MRYLGFLFPVRCPRTACCSADSSPFEPRGSLLMSAQPSRRKCRTLRARLLAQCQSGVVDGNALACHGVNFPRSRFGLVLSFRHEPSGASLPQVLQHCLLDAASHAWCPQRRFERQLRARSTAYADLQIARLFSVNGFSCADGNCMSLR